MEQVLVKRMWILSWKNRFGELIQLTHQCDSDVYKWGEILINERKDVRVCQMSI